MLISVIVPIYNAEKYLRKCLKSIIKQSFSNIEIILINDGSTDSSSSICRVFAAKDERITLINQENKGSVEARRTGVNQAKGEYITFVDADDVLPVDSIKNLYNGLGDKHDCVVMGLSGSMYKGIVFSKSQPYCFENAPKRMEIDYFMQEYYCSWFGITNVPVSLWGKLFPTHIIKAVYQSLIPGEIDFLGDDLVITLQAFPLAQSVFFTPEIVYFYRIGGGTAKYRPSMLKEFVSLYKFKMPFAEKYKMRQDVQYFADREMCFIIHSYLISKKENENLSREKAFHLVKEMLDDGDINQITSNAKLLSDSNPTIRHFAEKNVEAIVDDIFKKKILKENIKNNIKSILYRI